MRKVLALVWLVGGRIPAAVTAGMFLAGIVVNCQDDRRARRATGFDLMPSSGQVIKDRLIDFAGQRQTAQLRLKVAKPVDVVVRAESRSFDGGEGIHAKDKSIEQNLQRSLILLIPACNADGKDRLIILEDQRGRQRDPRSLAGIQLAGMIVPGS